MNSSKRFIETRTGFQHVCEHFMDDSGDVDYLRGVRVSLIFKVVVFNNIITCLE
jgi:hypothetical protein